MINEKQIVNKVLEEGESQASIGMSLDMESAQVLMQMLSKNLYSDPIGSTVRECASNALDSHRAAKVDEAIIVSLKVNDQNNYEFSVEDFGTGLNDDDVKNIISKYGKSSKRESNDYIGMMGLGFKSPLAYASSFYFICRKDGVERKYMMYEGETENTIDLLYETKTDKRNGVKIIVPVKYNDRYTFLEKIKEQLAYFESVYFDVNVQNDVISNEFNIFRADHFQISELNADNNMHICLDNVYYPIDYQKIGISPISIPVGLRFSLSDGLFPVPNREQLIYSAVAKKIILDKIGVVADYFVNKYNEISIDCKNVSKIFSYYSDNSRPVTICNITVDAAKFVDYTKIAFNKPNSTKYPLTDFKYLYRNKDFMFNEYKIMIEYRNGQFRQQANGYRLSYNDIVKETRIFKYEELFVGHKKSYIKSLLPVNDWKGIKFIKKTNKFTLRRQNHKAYGTITDYITLLELNKYPKDTWRNRIQEFNSILDELMAKVEFVDTVVIPQSWLDARKKKKVSMIKGGTKRVKLQGEMNVRFADELQRYVTGKNSKLTPTVIKVAEIESSKKLIVYGRSKDENLIDKLYSVSSKQRIQYLVLSEREHKVAETLDIHNFIPIDKFMEGKNKPFKRIVTSYLIHKLIDKYNQTFHKASLMKNVSIALYERLNLLMKYDEDNYHRIGDEDVYLAMVDVAKQYKLFDETIYTEYNQLKELLDGFPFIESTMFLLKPSYSGEIQQCYLDVLIDLFKYNKIRINYTNYELVLNEDVKEPITEETMDQLINNN